MAGWYLLLPSRSQIAVIVGVPGLRCMQTSSRSDAGAIHDGGQHAIDRLEDLGVVDRAGQLDAVQDGIAAEPFERNARLFSRPWSLSRWTSSKRSESSRHFSGPDCPVSGVGGFSPLSTPSRSSAGRVGRHRREVGVADPGEKEPASASWWSPNCLC